MSTPELVDAYQRLCGHEAFDSSHVSLDRDHQGNEVVNVAPDWVEGAGLGFAVELARELELEAVLTKGGLRLAPYSDGLSRGVQRVKRVLEDASDEEAYPDE